jgi:hypothetical protein
MQAGKHVGLHAKYPLLPDWNQNWIVSTHLSKTVTMKFHTTLFSGSPLMGNEADGQTNRISATFHCDHITSFGAY